MLQLLLSALFVKTLVELHSLCPEWSVQLSRHYSFFQYRSRPFINEAHAMVAVNMQAIKGESVVCIEEDIRMRTLFPLAAICDFRSENKNLNYVWKTFQWTLRWPQSYLQYPSPWLSSVISTDLVEKSVAILTRNRTVKVLNPGRSSPITAALQKMDSSVDISCWFKKDEKYSNSTHVGLLTGQYLEKGFKDLNIHNKLPMTNRNECLLQQHCETVGHKLVVFGFVGLKGKILQFMASFSIQGEILVWPLDNFTLVHFQIHQHRQISSARISNQMLSSAFLWLNQAQNFFRKPADDCWEKFVKRKVLLLDWIAWCWSSRSVEFRKCHFWKVHVMNWANPCMASIVHEAIHHRHGEKEIILSNLLGQCNVQVVEIGSAVCLGAFGPIVNDIPDIDVFFTKVKVVHTACSFKQLTLGFHVQGFP